MKKHMSVQKERKLYEKISYSLRFFMIKIKNTNKNIGCTILDISILCAIIQSNI